MLNVPEKKEGKIYLLFLVVYIYGIPKLTLLYAPTT
jgi:hypothetical protein